MNASRLVLSLDDLARAASLAYDIAFLSASHLGSLVQLRIIDHGPGVPTTQRD